MKTFNQLNFFTENGGELYNMENIKNIEESIITYTSAWNETERGRFSWLAIRPEGYPVQGTDYFEFNDENRITRIVGFF